MAAAPADALVAFADRLADAAAEAIRPYFRTAVGFDAKADLTPVTAADRAAEDPIRRLLAAEHPSHGIIGEERGRQDESAEHVWAIDPIDGTKAFISGIPTFGTLIGLFHRGRPVLGIIDQPISRERWLGVAGRPATLNGRTIRTRPCRRLADAALFATAPEMFEGSAEAAFRRLRGEVRMTRYSGDCYAYGLAAAGFIDLVVEHSLKVWDWAALVPVLEGAGGIITDWSGKPLTLGAAGDVIAAGDPALHALALDVLDCKYSKNTDADHPNGSSDATATLT